MGRKKRQIDAALRFWRLTHLAKRLGGTTPFRQAAGLVASEPAFRGSYIPVGENVEVGPGTAAPRDLIEDFVTRACNRTIINFCPCRSGEGCHEYPGDLGCLMLGSASRQIDPEVGRRATVEEAMEHVDLALSLGLLPLIGHMRIDKYVFGVKDASKLLTVCFCCRCCCVLRSEMGRLVRAYPGSLMRLEGVEVVVRESCTGCGVCVPACPVENVALVGGKAVMGDSCIGCGTCASVCPGDAVALTVRPGVAWLEDLRRRVEAGVDIEEG